MSDERRPYSRVYWSVMDDEKFDGIREDVRLFGSWSLLLVAADMAYPSPAFIPRTVPQSAIRRLEACELIDLLPGHRYRVHGLASERHKRSQSGRNAAALRWQSERDARQRQRQKTKGKHPLSVENGRSSSPRLVHPEETA